VLNFIAITADYELLALEIGNGLTLPESFKTAEETYFN